MAEKKKDDSALVAEEMAEGEDPHESDEQKKEKEEKQKKNDEFNRVPDDIKNEAAAEQLGAELVQLGGQAVGIKGSLIKNIKRLNLAQIRNKDGASSDGSEEGETISDLTNKAKDEISNSTAQTDSKKDDAPSQEKKEEKKEEPKKEEEKKESEGDDDDGEKKKEDDASKKEEGSKEHTLAASEQSSNSSGNATQAAQSDEDAVSNANKDVKVVAAGKKGADPGEAMSDGTTAILITGATHARELLSSQVPLFVCLKLLHQGYLQNNEKY